MSKSNRRRELERTIAGWLNDSYGDEGDEDVKFSWAARDLLRYMRANGWALQYRVKLARQYGKPGE